ncbi:sigma factor [Methylomicrobium lacus]|uniref:sigma factor n=1 Tax=Methylomicrobium lacus TaxID=136992 RepID=UPI00045E895B|nr:sigma factor [Methylomicrobium lacus]
MIFEKFFNKNKCFLYKTARSFNIESGDILGTAWLSWHDASKTYRPDRGATLETWALRQFEHACRRYAAQGRYGAELDADGDDRDMPIVSDDAAIFAVIEPEPERILQVPRFGGGITGEVWRAAAAGKSVAEIASRVGRTPRRINQLLAKMRPDPQQTTLFDFA